MMAYFDCFSGISGDMTLGALMISACRCRGSRIHRFLAAARLDISVCDVEYNGIKAKRVEVHAHGDHHHRHFSDIRA